MATGKPWPSDTFDLLRGVARHAVCGVLFVLTFAVLAAWYIASERRAGQQDQALVLSKIMILPASAAAAPVRETVITLGRKHLLQNEALSAAAEQHVRIHRLSNVGWKISSASANRPLLLEFADGAEYLASRQLVGTALTAHLSNRTERFLAVKVEALPDESIRIRLEPRSGVARTYRIDVRSSNIRLCPETGPVATCIQQDVGLFRQLSERVKGVMGVSAKRERTIVRFGGPVTAVRDGMVYLAIPDYPFAGFNLVSIPQRGLAFAPGRDRAVRFSRGNPANGWSIFEVAHDMAMADEHIRLKSFIAGRTRYAVQIESDRNLAGALRITPVDAVHRAALDAGPGIGGDLEPFEAPNQVYAATERVPATLEKWRGAWTNALKYWWYGLSVLVVAYLGCWLIVAVCRRFATPYQSWPTPLEWAWRVPLVALAITVWLSIDFLFALPKGAASPSAPYPAIAAWAIAAVSVFTAQGSGNHLRLIFLVVTAIAAAGAYIMLTLGLSADELRWSRFHNETVGTIAIGAAVVALVSALPTELLGGFANALARPGRPSRLAFWPQGRHLISFGLTTVFLAWSILAVAWWGLGSETGIPGFGQPSEVMKSLFVVIGASVVTLIVRHWFGTRLKPSRPQIVASLFGLGTILAIQLGIPILSHDFSPFLILALTSLLSFLIVLVLYMCASWATRASSPVQMRNAPFETPGYGFLKQRFWRGLFFPLAAIALVLAVVGGLAWAYVAVPQNQAKVQAYLLDLPDFLRKPARRLGSWVELDLIHLKGSVDELPIVEFPDVGLQVIRSRESLESAPCRIVPSADIVDRWSTGILRVMPAARNGLLALDGLLGRVCPRQADEEIVSVGDLSLPEIQNDFVAAWAIQALGRDGAFMLILLQFALVCLMLWAAFRVMRWRSGDEDRRAASTFLASAIVGFSVMLFLQFSISWMNALGLLPVMGQPMTFVSHGRSHFLFFGIPAILSVAFGLRVARNEAPQGFGTLLQVPKRRQFKWRGGGRKSAT